MYKAGSNNKGAWQRAMKELKKLSSFALYGLGATIGDDAKFDPIWNALNHFYAHAPVREEGMTYEDKVAYARALIINGIPWQVWSGHLSTDTYVKSTDSVTGKVRYTPVNRNEFRKASSFLRKTIRDFLRYAAEFKDLENLLPANQGNPGGIADGNITT